MECPHCHATNDDDRRTCRRCEGALSVSLAPERRQLTVMFCDLVGSTALAHELDPEDFRDVIVRFHRDTQRLIRRYEGYVAQYLGDGVLAYFGYPLAHEDGDAARAIHAGLELAALRHRAEDVAEGRVAPSGPGARPERADRDRHRPGGGRGDGEQPGVEGR